MSLAGLFSAQALAYSVIKTGSARHIVLRIGKGRPLLAFAAHYDRVPGSPGVLDNSCACLQLASFAIKRKSIPSPPLLFLFTDAEEAPGTGKAEGQGSFALARALAGGSRKEKPFSALASDSGKADARGVLTASKIVGTSDPRLESLGGKAPSPEEKRAIPPILVFDVTGRGDRLLLSSSPSALFERNGLCDSAPSRAHDYLARLARDASSRAGMSRPLTHPLPWSDDLGLILGGLGALTISLLPAQEAELLAAGGRPPTWDFLHSPADGPELAEERAFEIIALFLDAVVAELEKDGGP